MRHVSPKRRLRNQEARPVRELDIAGCEWCLRPARSFYPSITIEEHHIANGPLRQQADDCLFAKIYLCSDCHRVSHRMAKEDWQRMCLAILYLSRTADYDLAAFNQLVNPRAPNRITQAEVDLWIRRILRNDR